LEKGEKKKKNGKTILQRMEWNEHSRVFGTKAIHNEQVSTQAQPKGDQQNTKSNNPN
jgi:hypothetical protein